MAVYRVTGEQLTSIANAIRAKGGTADALTFPGGFAAAVGALSGTPPCIEYAVNASGDVTRAKLWGFTKIPDYFFYHQLALTEVDLSESPGITTIGLNAFSGCTHLGQITLPDAVTTISERAFESCSALTMTALPAGVTSLGLRAFTACGNLALTSLPAGLTSIPDNAFQNCRKLALTSLPAGLTSVGVSSFSNCAALALSLIPASLTSFGNGAFSGCTGMVNLEVACQTLGTGTRIFQACTGLQKVWLRSSCETVTAGSGTYAPFTGCVSGLLLFAEPAEKPAGWGSFFNRVTTGGAVEASVTWGQTARPW